MQLAVAERPAESGVGQTARRACVRVPRLPTRSHAKPGTSSLEPRRLLLLLAPSTPRLALSLFIVERSHISQSLLLYRNAVAGDNGASNNAITRTFREQNATTQNSTRLGSERGASASARS